MPAGFADEGRDMDETQLNKLGRKMRDTYVDVASEAPVPAVAAPKHPSRRLRKSRAFARASRRTTAPGLGGATGGFVVQHPLASLLIAAGVGYVLGRL